MSIWWFVSILFRAAFQPTRLPYGCRPLDDLLRRRFSCCRISSAPHDSCLFRASADNLLPALSRPAYLALGSTTNPSRPNPAPLTQTTPPNILPGSEARTPLPPDLPPNTLPGSVARTPLPPDPPCDTCALPGSHFCLSCDHPVCSRHLYPCSDCQLALCGNCFDLHTLEGHWSDSDTALALARTLRLGSQHLCQQTNLSPSPGRAPLRDVSPPPHAFFKRLLPPRRAPLRDVSPPPHAFFKRLLPPRRAPLGDIFFPQPLRALPRETIQ